MNKKIVAFNEYSYEQYRKNINEDYSKWELIVAWLKHNIQLDHDFFSATSTAIYIRIISELENEGKLTFENYLEKMYPGKDLSPESKKAHAKPYWTLLYKIRDVDESFNKLIPNLFPRTYYRGIIPDGNRGIVISSKAKIGDIITPDSGFAFAASNKEIALDFAGKNENNPENHILLIIKAPPGTKVSTNLSHLKETVFPRNAQYEVIDKKTEDGRTVLYLKYILPKQQNNTL
ncbi:MAG: hypothetical protein WCH76_00585 [Candidatus Riflemargulisbacteria bacterium]